MGRYLDAVAGANQILQSNGVPQPTTQQRPVAPAVSQKPQQPVAQTQTEKPRTFFQGNVIDKAIDVAQVPEYMFGGFMKGAVGDAKTRKQAGAPDLGKSIWAGVTNIPKGVIDRTGIGGDSNQYDAGAELGLTGVGKGAYNLGLSLALPSMPIGKIAKVTGLEKAAVKVGSKVVDVARKIEPVANAVEKVVPYFKNPEFGKLVQGAEERTQGRLQELYKMVSNAVTGLTPAEQARVGQILEGGVSSGGTKAGEYATSKFEQIAAPIREFSDMVGNEAVDLGLLDATSYEKYKGQYMSHIWNDMVKNGADSELFAKKAVPQVSGKFFQKRTGAEGYVKQFGPAVFKGLGTQIKDIETTKFYKNIAQEYGVNSDNIGNLADPENYRLLSREVSKKFGDKNVFKDLLLPKDVAKYIEEKVAAKAKPGIADKAMDLWKKGKTIYNPAYHVRNNLSNPILADLSTGEGIPATLMGQASAARQLSGKGDQAMVEAAKSVGLIDRKNFGEMFSDTLDAAGLGKKDTGNIISRGAKKVDTAITGLQSKSEDVAKLNVFTSWINKFADEAKITVQEALQNPDMLKKAKDKAEEAIFSPYRISQKERGVIRNLGIPFYSFTRQAVPLVGKTLYNNPDRITKYDKAKRAIESISAGTPENRPDYAKDAVRLPVKNAEGNNYYFDPQYILPWGNMGDPGIEQGKLPFGLSFNPFITTGTEIGLNKSFYTGKPITKSNVPQIQNEDKANYALRAIGPSIISTAQKLGSAIMRKPDYYGRTRSVKSAALDAIGLKNAVYPKEIQDQNDAYTNLNKLRSLQSEMKSVMRNQSYNESEKKRRIDLILKEISSMSVQ